MESGAGGTHLESLPGAPFVTTAVHEGDSGTEATDAATAMAAFWGAIADRVDTGGTFTLEPGPAEWLTR